MTYVVAALAAAAGRSADKAVEKRGV